MSFYHVEHAPEHRFPRLYLSAATVLLAALVAVGVPSFSRVDLTVDGAQRVLPSGATAQDLIEEGWVAPSGDVLDVEGSVVAMGDGPRAVIMRGGAELAPSERLADGDRIVTIPGADVAESVVTTRVPIPIEVEYQGTGPLVMLVSPGAVGIEERVIGEYSGRVETSTIVLAAEPMVVKRTIPHRGDKVVALTFDDGPWPEYTEAVLDVLKNTHAKATFFMIGRQVKRYPAVAKRVVDEGHLVGNHSYNHVYMSSASPSLVRAEMAQSHNVIWDVTGARPSWFRPPGGIMTPAVGQQASRLGQRIAMWTVDPQDWRRIPAPLIAKRVVGSVRPGSVVLMHDGGGDRSKTVEALGPIISELKKQGYTFVTLDELAP